MPPLEDAALDQLFLTARTHYAWRDEPVSDDTLRRLYEVMRWAPTRANTNPARLVFLRTDAAKARLFSARALGLDVGPISGLDNAKVDEEFFGAGKECAGCDQEFFPEGHVRSNFLCNLGYGDPSRLFPRLPRLSFEEACSLL